MFDIYENEKNISKNIRSERKKKIPLENLTLPFYKNLNTFKVNSEEFEDTIDTILHSSADFLDYIDKDELNKKFCILKEVKENIFESKIFSTDFDINDSGKLAMLIESLDDEEFNKIDMMLKKYWDLYKGITKIVLHDNPFKE